VRTGAVFTTVPFAAVVRHGLMQTTVQEAMRSEPD